MKNGLKQKRKSDQNCFRLPAKAMPMPSSVLARCGQLVKEGPGPVVQRSSTIATLHSKDMSKHSSALVTCISTARPFLMKMRRSNGIKKPQNKDMPKHNIPSAKCVQMISVIRRHSNGITKPQSKDMPKHSTDLVKYMRVKIVMSDTSSSTMKSLRHRHFIGILKLQNKDTPKHSTNWARYMKILK